jgi:hypothetical protein
MLPAVIGTLAQRAESAIWALSIFSAAPADLSPR